MQGAVRQIAVYRSGNVNCRKVKIVSAAGGKGVLHAVGYQHLTAAVCQSVVIAVCVIDKEDVFVCVRQDNTRSRLGKGDILTLTGQRLQRHANRGSAAGKIAGDLDGHAVGKIDVVVRIVRFVILYLHRAGEPERALAAHVYTAAVGRRAFGGYVSGDLAAGHGKDGVEVLAANIHTAAGFESLVFTDLAAGHGKYGSRCSVVGSASHMQAAAGFMSLVFTDLAAVHGKGTITVHKHATTVRCGVALDCSAIHGEGAILHAHTRTPIIIQIVAADSSAIHSELAARDYRHANSCARTAVGNDAAIDGKAVCLVLHAQLPCAISVCALYKIALTAAAVAIGQRKAAVSHNINHRRSLNAVQ